LAAADDSVARLNLSRTLRRAADSAQSTAESFGLRTESLRLAIAGGSATTALKEATALASEFETDALALEANTVEELAGVVKSVDDRRLVAATALRLIDDAIAADQFPRVDSLLAAIGKVTAEQTNSAFDERVAQARARAKTAAELFRAYESARPKLDGSSPDNAANYAAARYFCFNRRNWSAGMEYYALTGDEPLKSIAVEDWNDPADPAKQRALEAQWRQLAAKASGIDRDLFQTRADHWRTAAAGR
jgi:hypothetical protein